MLPVLRAVGFIPLILAAKLRREERRLVNWLRGRGALDSSNAVTIAEERAVARWVRQRLLRGGAIGDAGSGRYYLSEPRYSTFCARRRRRAMVVVALLGIGCVIAFYLGVV